MRPKLAQDMVAAIVAAPLTETAHQVGARLGINEQTVRNYRKAHRQQQQELTREALAAHIQASIPDVLGDLNRLRQMAAKVYEEGQDPENGRLWLAAIKATLDHVSPADDDIDREIQAEMERLAASEQAPATRTAQEYPVHQRTPGLDGIRPGGGMPA